MIHYVKGNLCDALLNDEIDILVHGCNCFCTMGAGIAKEIKTRFPGAYLADKLTQCIYSKNKLGEYTFTVLQNDKYIVNAYTQHTHWDPSDMLDYDAVRKVFTKIEKAFQSKRIGMPFIGCGLAKGNWKKISSIIEEIFQNRDIFVYYINDADYKKNVLMSSSS